MNARYLMLLLNWFVGSRRIKPQSSSLTASERLLQPLLLGFPASLAKIMYSRHKARAAACSRTPFFPLPSFLPSQHAAATRPQLVEAEAVGAGGS